jgi:hypothetical protein
MKRQRLLGIALVAGLLGLGASPALAVGSSSMGAVASRSGNTVSVRDAKADNSSVYANVNTTSTRLNNLSGYNATVSRTYTFKVTAIRACVDVNFQSDPCSAWG